MSAPVKGCYDGPEGFIRHNAEQVYTMQAAQTQCEGVQRTRQCGLVTLPDPLHTLKLPVRYFRCELLSCIVPDASTLSCSPDVPCGYVYFVLYCIVSDFSRTNLQHITCYLAKCVGHTHNKLGSGDARSQHSK